MKPLVGLCSLLLALYGAGALAADWHRVLLGTWVSPDGSARQQFTERLDGSLIETRMWFRQGKDWKLVGVGIIYRRPESDSLFGVSRATDMGGPELFESEYRQDGDGIRVLNRAYDDQGERSETEESWRFPTPQRFDYQVFKLQDGRRQAWFDGRWEREYP